MEAVRVFTERSHAILCPACGARLETFFSDVNGHDSIEVRLDCDCGAKLYTVSVQLVVVSLAADEPKADARANRIRKLAGARDLGS